MYRHLAAGLLVTVAGPAAAIDAPVPRVEGTALVWSAVDAPTINVHRGDGGYVTSLPAGTTRWSAIGPGSYFLVGADGGDWRGWPRSRTVEVGDAPAGGGPVVSGLRASVYSSSALELFWQPVAGATRFELRRDGQVVATLDGRSRFESGLPAGTSYRYEVVAIDADGRRGPPARVDARTSPGDGTNPFQPTDPSNPEPPANAATPSMPRALRGDVYSGRSAELFWQAPARGTATGYEIVRNGRAVGTTTGRSFFDDGLYPGVTWSYAVRAVNPRGSSDAAFLRFTTDDSRIDASVPALPATPVAAPPANLRAVGASDTAIELAWTPVDEGTTYGVYRDGVRIATSSATRYPADGLRPGTAYRFAVRADNGADAPGSVDSPAFPDAYGVARTVAFTSGDAGIDLSPGGGTLPADCIAATGDGLAFCFSPATRELLAVRGDGTTWWRFALPGSTDTNDVRHLVWTRDTLVLVARVTGPDGVPAWEMSTFAASGAFRGTFALEVEEGRSIDADDADALQATGGRYGLLVLAPLRDGAAGGADTSDAGAAADAGGTVAVLRYDVSTGRPAALRVLSPPAGLPLGFTRGGGEGRDTFGVEAGGASYTLEEPLLGDGDGGPPLSPGARYSTRDLVSGWLDADAASALTLDELLPLASDALTLDVVVDPAGEIVSRTLACPDGGRAVELSPPGRAFVTWHYRFDDCIVGDRLLSGEALATAIFSGARLGGSTSTSARYTGFGMRWANGDEVRLDGARDTTSGFGFGGGACGSTTSANAVVSLAALDTRFGGLASELDALESTESTSGSQMQVRDVDGAFVCVPVTKREGTASARVRSDLHDGAAGSLSLEFAIARDASAPNAPGSEATQSIVLDDGSFQRDVLRGADTVTSEIGGPGGATIGTFVDRWRF